MRMSTTLSNMKSIVDNAKPKTVMNRRNNSQNAKMPDLPPKTRYSNLMNSSMSSNPEKKFMKTEALGFKRSTISESRGENKSPALNVIRNRSNRD